MKIKNRLAYTLIELLVSMGIFAVMMLLLLNFFSRYQDFVSVSSTRNELLSDSAVFMSQIEKDIKSAYTHVRVKYDGEVAPVIPINVSADSLRLVSRSRFDPSTHKNDIDSGQGGLSEIHYWLDDDKIKRVAKDLNNDDLADTTYDGATETSETILRGVVSLNFKVFVTREAFLSNNPSTSLGDFYLQEIQSVTVPKPIYGVLVTVTLKDPNPNVDPTSDRAKLIKRDIKSFITVQP
ncbi:MAG: hypothetical protein RL095_2604 [Verrucomicrobiota bacterium]|jgi:type II secretory pathway component PulJ